MKNILFLLALILVLFSSCKSDDDLPEPVPADTFCELTGLTIFTPSQNFEFTFEMENGKVTKKSTATTNGEFYEAEYDSKGMLRQLQHFTYNTSAGEYQLSTQTVFTHNSQGRLTQKVYKEATALDSIITEYLYEGDILRDEISYRSNGDTTATVRYFFDMDGRNVDLKETTLLFPDFSIFFFQIYEFDDQLAHQPLDPTHYPQFNTNNITRMKTFHTTQPDDDFVYRYTYNGQDQPEEVYIAINGEEEQLLRQFFYDCP